MPKLTLIIAGFVMSIANLGQAEQQLVFVSSFAPGDQGGIQAFHLDDKTGELTAVQRTGGIENPFFMVLSPNRKYLYSIHAPGTFGKDQEEVAAYELVGDKGELKLLNRKSSHGSASCYLDIDSSGRAVVVANYTSGNVASLATNRDGSLSDGASVIQHTGSSINPARQKEPHAHCFVISPDGKFALAADLGLDQIICYRREVTGFGIGPNQPPFAKSPAGAGPRHLTFHPNGKHVYVINELKNSISVFDYQSATGTLTERQIIPTLPEDFKGTSHCADLKITPNGKFLYGTNRGHDSIALYLIGEDGKLTLQNIEPSLGKGPQNLAITANGQLLLCANMPGNNVAVFRINQQTGALKQVAESTKIPSPSCIRIR